MRTQLFRRTGSHTSGILLLCVLLLALASISQAQSGRRPPKQPKSPDPFPSKQEEPPITPSSSAQNSRPQIPVKVIWYLQSINISQFYPRIVQEGCLEQLSRAASVKASGDSDLNRKQASDIAKKSTDTYVLWYELDIDSLEASRGNYGPQYFEIRYEVFSPGTGKTKTTGRVYQRPRGPVGMPLPGPGTPASAEYSLKYAGREMADRLLDTLSLPHPTDRH